ncbi:MAG: hypothetical protein ACRDFY_00680 [Candidatus Limnocylindria bacterium]
MSPVRLDRLRLPAALVLILIAGFILWPRDAAVPVAAVPPPPPVIVGEPEGEVVPAASPTPEPTLIPTATAAGTPSPTPAPTPAPPAADGFSAEVLACRSISGSSCNGQVDELPPSVGAFTAVVRFTDATAGDLLNAIVSGPGGTITGTPYALQGSGNGYFWAEFRVGGLPSGDYVLTATRNGVEVAATSFRKLGG